MENIQAQDWAQLNVFKEENMKLDLPKPNEDRIVFYGNSITIGWLHAIPEFFEGKPYINRGISGQTTPQMLVRFRQDVVALQPKVVVILAGTNDIAGNTGPSTTKMIADNLFSMAEIAKENNIQVIFSSILPVYDYPWRPGLNPSQKIIDVNEILKQYAKDCGHTYLDYFSEMVNDRNGLIKEYGRDGVHPNKTGYKVMIPLVQKAIEGALKKD